MRAAGAAAMAWIGAAGMAGAAAGGGAVDEFDLSVESVVEPGVPGPGAGEIEAPGNQDVYDLAVVAGQRLFFDNLAFSDAGLRWRAIDSAGEQVFSSSIFSDRGPFEVLTDGTWTIIVDDTGDDTGTYSFIVWDTMTDGPFAIDPEFVVEPGVPGAGAGSIEEPGDEDVYALDVVVGQRLFFDNLAFSESGLRWRVLDDEGTQIFSSSIFSDRGPYEVTSSGTWTVVVDDDGDDTGTYSFTVWDTRVDGPFAIDLESVVEPGLPAAGAGEIEEPGDQDRYTLDVRAGQRLFFDNLAFSNAGLRWRVVDAEDQQVFSSSIFSDRGPFEVTSPGTWSIIVDDTGDDAGTYSFTVWDTRVDGPFAIDLESVVEPGVPADGAGEIEEPGDQDRYTFDVVAGQTLFFDNLAFSKAGLRWRVIDADGQQVYSSSIFSDRGPFEVASSGTWEIIVDDDGDAAGTYSFVVWDTENDTFEIGINQIVDVDTPGPGAGWIEHPGNIDRYLIEGLAGDVWCAVNLAFESPQLRWRLLDPEGGQLFSSAIFSDQSSLPLELDGTYTLEVFGAADGVGTYAFVVNRTTRADITGDCVVGFDDLLALLAAWGPCDDPADCDEDVDEDGIVGFADILEVLANWTQ
jgi:hypothetical protein